MTAPVQDSLWPTRRRRRVLPEQSRGQGASKRGPPKGATEEGKPIVPGCHRDNRSSLRVRGGGCVPPTAGSVTAETVPVRVTATPARDPAPLLLWGRDGASVPLQSLDLRCGEREVRERARGGVSPGWPGACGPRPLRHVLRPRQPSSRVTRPPRHPLRVTTEPAPDPAAALRNDRNSGQKVEAPRLGVRPSECRVVSFPTRGVGSPGGHPAPHCPLGAGTPVRRGTAAGAGGDVLPRWAPARPGGHTPGRGPPGERGCVRPLRPSPGAVAVEASLAPVRPPGRP